MTGASNILNIVLIGAGNVANSIGPALQTVQQFKIVQVWSKTKTSAELLANKLNCDYTTNIGQINKNADVYIYMLKDSVLGKIIDMLKLPDTALHIHTGGSIGLEVFDKSKPHCGVMYPFQTFSRQRQISVEQVPIFVEGKTTSDCEKIKYIASQISSQVYDFNTEHRKWLHIAGVFANNFSNVMLGIAAEMAQQAGLSQEVLLPLMHETVNKLHTMTAKEAQTGPAVRGDKEVMRQHIDAIDNPQYKELYIQLSDIILQRSKH